MNSIDFHDTKAEKANAILRRRRMQRITALFRFAELLIFLIITSRFSTQYAFSPNLSGAWFNGIPAALTSHRFVFLAGNAIVVVLLLTSGRFSPDSGGKLVDFYDEYVGRSRGGDRRKIGEKERRGPGGACGYGVVGAGREMNRCESEMVGKAAGRVDEVRRDLRRSASERCGSEIVGRAAGRREEVRRDLRRSSSDRCRESGGDGGRRTAGGGGGGGCSLAEDEMSGEEFRRTVEAFIARQQRILREE
ncbi:testis- and ovary-specific PAZ domain-containing protein 1 [Striga asiatica]|uniref:Testis-and ovary-specific PAZ domain-containing protein 1 n=1 Tax=Striga asiatica TaxID=4170 RepID=A0A5A7QD23_STRAF|nr:testis- and ovary-specific PAZ domain-containing protein 1 [Striga asiatica]